MVLHLAIIGIAVTGWSWTNPKHDPPPRSISARLITPQPKPSPIVEPDDQPDRDELRKAEEQARKLAEQKAREDAERKTKALEQKREQAEKQKREEQAKIKEAARIKAEAEAKAKQRKDAEAEKQKQAEAKRKAEEEKRRIEEQKKQEEQKRQEEAERQKQKEAAERKRQEAERKLREQHLKATADQAAQAEKAEAQKQAQAAAARARDAQMMTESEKYQALIRERLKQAWYIPSSATEEMEARLQITLLPTGELAGVKLISGSGNAAFDNSALSAACFLNRYPIPGDRDTFERYFRQFTIEFNPRRLR